MYVHMYKYEKQKKEGFLFLEALTQIVEIVENHKFKSDEDVHFFGIKKG